MSAIPPPGFVHLRVHSEYSLIDSVVRIPPLIQAVAAHGMPAVALTDESNLCALVKFYKAAQSHGIKPVVGVDLWVHMPATPDLPARLTLLCCDERGYRNLTRLVTRGYLEGQVRGQPRLQPDWLDRDSVAGLIALSGGREGDVGRALIAGREDTASACLARWLDLFGDRYYLELTRTGRPDEETHVAAAVQLAAQTGVPVVATNDVRFLRPDDFESHEARVCIQRGHTLADPARPRDYSEHQYLKTPAEMAELFSDVPEALANTVAVAQRCNLPVRLGGTVLPAFPIPDDRSAEQYLADQSWQGLQRRLQHDGVFAPREEYDARLQTELDVICGMGFSGYFLIVADFIRWAKENEIPVGPGRGSGGGSLVAYALGIVDLDPLRYELLFERFLNPERVSMPDFDIDFCMERRDEVIGYVTERYGRDRVSQIITYGTMAARAVVRDVGRVLAMPYGYVDRIAKLVPFEIGMTLEKAMTDPELSKLYGDEEEVRTLIDLARKLEGLVRNAGRHAGGVVIAPAALTDYSPLYCEQGSDSPVTQFDKDDVEAVGLVKFDFLGLKTLTIIDWAVRTINEQRREQGLEPLEIGSIPLDDERTFQLLSSGQTTAVFQVESRGMRDLIKRLQPDRFDGIIPLVALFRPGPLQSGMVDDFINRKHDSRSDQGIDYFHPWLEPILAPTYGVILYQEQVMQIAQVLAGYSLGEADLLRRAMGKKKPEEMARQRSVFLDGAERKGVDIQLASYIFDLMEKFAGYGFNKSHSAAYALLTYQTAWLKTNHPAAFMSAVLTADMDNTDKLVMLQDDLQRMGLQLLPPDVNASSYEFTVASERSIRYGLGAIKGLGQGAIQSIADERRRGGPFTGLYSFCARVGGQGLNRRAFEALIRAGALDPLGANRATLMHNLPGAMLAAEQQVRAQEAGQNDLFGAFDTAAEAPEQELEWQPDWSERERLAAEKESLGLYLTGHPFRRYAEHCRHFTVGTLADLATAPSGPGHRQSRRDVAVAGLVVDLRRRGARRTVLLDDGTGRLEVTLFEEQARDFGHLLAIDEVLVVRGSLRFDDFLDGWRLSAQTVTTADDAIAQHARGLVICWDEPERGGDFVAELQAILAPHRTGHCDVRVDYRTPRGRAVLSLGASWRIRPGRELRERLTALIGEDRYRLLYPRVAEAGDGGQP